MLIGVGTKAKFSNDARRSSHSRLWPNTHFYKTIISILSTRSSVGTDTNAVHIIICATHLCILRYQRYSQIQFELPLAHPRIHAPNVS